MKAEFHFGFSNEIDLTEAEGTMRLALLAAEGVFGEARVRTDVSYSVEPPRGEIRVHGQPDIVETVARVFTTLASREFGRGSFTIRPGLEVEAAVTAR